MQLGGSAVAGEQVGDQASTDLAMADLLAFPLLALLALVVFRGIAALLPLLMGLGSVLGTFLVLRGVDLVHGLSVFSLNLVIALGLGLAVDYSLFVVSRFREEVGGGADVPGAVRATMQTAGRTVVFSSLTVAAAMAALIVFPLNFLKSMGIGGVVVALVAAAVSLTVLPALLVLLGARVGRHRAPGDGGRWGRFAHAVMRHRGVVAVATLAVFVVVSPRPCG